MKKKIITIFILFLTVFGYSQKCLSDEYLNSRKKNDRLLNAKILNVISGFGKNEKNIKNKSISTQELIGEEIIIIPVVFNVIHSGEPIGTGKNISLTKIEEQINLMNEAYSGKYGGIDTRIRFCLAKQNTVGQATTGVNRFYGEQSYDLGVMLGDCVFSSVKDKAIKSNFAPGFPSNLFLNIWTADLVWCRDDTLLGFSSNPFETNLTDGIILDYLQVGINVTSDPNNPNRSNGTTLTHEVGHWLGLFHIFSDIGCNETSCETQGDMICDTDPVPAEGISNVAGNCKGYNCNGILTDVVQNFMDYQSPARLYCQTKFTLGQKKRMRDILSFYRPSIYNQGTDSSFNLTACKRSSYGGGVGGSNCYEDSTLPIQKIYEPYIYQDLSHFTGTSIKFAETLEVNDKWLVTTYNTTAYTVVGDTKPNLPNVLDYILIYKREGCQYALAQSIEIPLSNVDTNTDFGLLLNGNEIIVTSSVKDEVYICRLNESNDKWGIVQQIKNESSGSFIGTSSYIIGRFLFILEDNKNGTNMFRIYYKDDNGYYVFHQNFGLLGMRLPTLGKYLQSGNFNPKTVNFNSTSFIGSYDPDEILVSTPSSTSFAMLELNSNNLWTLTSVTKPSEMLNEERILDIEASKDFIYVISSLQTGPDGSAHDVMYLYSYRITSNYSNILSSSFSKSTLITETDGISHRVKLKVFDDQFLLLDDIKYQPLSLYYNPNFGSTQLPKWQSKQTKKIACSNSNQDHEDFEVYGNLLFYGNSNFINIYNMSNILSREGFDQAFIDNSTFYNKKINIVPENFSTSAQRITVGESSKVNFNYVNKEFIANNNIVLKPGTTITRGSDVKLKITNSYGLCNSVITSKKNDRLDLIDYDINMHETEEIIQKLDKVILSPNPNNGIFTINFGMEKSISINCIVYDSTGKIVFIDNTDKPTLNINLPNLPTGVYLIKLKGNDYNEMIKFIKQ